MMQKSRKNDFNDFEYNDDDDDNDDDDLELWISSFVTFVPIMANSWLARCK